MVSTRDHVNGSQKSKRSYKSLIFTKTSMTLRKKHLDSNDMHKNLKAII